MTEVLCIGPSQGPATALKCLLAPQEVRDRYRYLSHLPLTCEFVLCELELRPPLLSRDILRMFSGECVCVCEGAEVSGTNRCGYI